MTRLGWALAVALFAMLVPALLALLVFPSPLVDLSENYASGRFLTFTTPEHPPMQVWVAGLVELVFGPSSFAAILVGQVFNLIGVIYLYATLARLTDGLTAGLFTFLFATSLYFIAAPLSYAINADILLVPIWAAVLFHLVRAHQTDRLGHWVGLALWTAAAVYTKYSAVILVAAMAIASLVVPDYRRLWRNPRFYGAIALTALLIAPHLIALRADEAAIANAEGRLHPDTPLMARLWNTGALLVGHLLYLVPGWITIAFGLLRGDFRSASPRPIAVPTIRFLQVTCIACFALLGLMTLAGGLSYLPRYDAPLFPLLVLAVAPTVAVVGERWDAAERRVLWSSGLVAAGVLVIATVAYGFFTGHDFLQEPTEEAAAIVRADWDGHYTCGPAYFLGDPSSAHGLALEGDRKAAGIALVDLGHMPWFDPERLKREGAIVVSRRPISADQLATYLPDAAPTADTAFSVPLLRTHANLSLTYHYFFLPPQACDRP